LTVPELPDDRSWRVVLAIESVTGAVADPGIARTVNRPGRSLLVLGRAAA